MGKYLIMATLFFVSGNKLMAQAPAAPAPGYLKVKGYVSVLHPIVTFDKNGHTFNFSHGYNVSVPIGINIYKSSKVGFSFEIAPAIKVVNDTSKVTNIVFHPGIIFPMKNNFAFLTRAAFETSGRYGFTPVLSKTLTKLPGLNYFATIATPVRFGNAKPTAIGIALQFGIVF